MSPFVSGERLRSMFSDTPREEQAMYLVPADARELDSRSSDGIDVTLLWSQATNRIWISVVDEKSGDWFEQDVHPALALDAFQHPYAYANRDRDEFAIAA
jgi:hypothetical protein